MRGALLGLLGLAGCPPGPLCVSAGDSSVDHLVVNVGKGGDCSAPVRVQQVTVTRAADRKVLWSGLNDKGVELSQVEYGMPSLGGKAAPLEPGTEIVVRVKSTLGESNTVQLTTTAAP